MIEEIIKHAPTGATHWQTGVYYKENDQGVWSMWKGYWESSFKWPGGFMTPLDLESSNDQAISKIENNINPPDLKENYLDKQETQSHKQGDSVKQNSSIDNLLTAITQLSPANLPEIEILPIADLQVGDDVVLVWAKGKEVWKVKALCDDGDVDIILERVNVEMSVPASDLRLAKFIKREMNNFEEVWKRNRHVWVSTKCLAKAMYLAGQESRQTEVEEASAKASICRDEKNHAIKRWGAIRQE